MYYLARDLLNDMSLAHISMDIIKIVYFWVENDPFWVKFGVILGKFYWKTLPMYYLARDLLNDMSLSHISVDIIKIVFLCQKWPFLGHFWVHSREILLENTTNLLFGPRSFKRYVTCPYFNGYFKNCIFVSKMTFLGHFWGHICKM